MSKLNSLDVLDYLKDNSNCKYVIQGDVTYLQLETPYRIIQKRRKRYSDRVYLGVVPSITASGICELSSGDLMREEGSLDFRKRTIATLLKRSHSWLEFDSFLRQDIGEERLYAVSFKMDWSDSDLEQNVLHQATKFLGIVENYFKFTYSRIGLWLEKRHIEKIKKN